MRRCLNLTGAKFSFAKFDPRCLPPLPHSSRFLGNRLQAIQAIHAGTLRNTTSLQFSNALQPSMCQSLSIRSFLSVQLLEQEQEQEQEQEREEEDKKAAERSVVRKNHNRSPQSHVILTRQMSTNAKSKRKAPDNPFKGKTPYEVLGITKSATAKEIKLAYYKTAKQYHPDTAPVELKEHAREHFQMVAAAYELLSDPGKKRMYDMSSTWGGGASSWTKDSSDTGGWQQKATSASGSSSASDTNWWSSQKAYGNQRAAEEQWSKIWDYTNEGRDVVEQALADYQEDLKEELLWAVDCVKRGEYDKAKEVVVAHKELFIGVGIPLVVLLRFPWLIMAAVGTVLRFGGLITQAAFLVSAALKMTGFGPHLWKKIVENARRRNHARRLQNERGGGAADSGAKAGGGRRPNK